MIWLKKKKQEEEGEGTLSDLEMKEKTMTGEEHYLSNMLFSGVIRH